MKRSIGAVDLVFIRARARSRQRRRSARARVLFVIFCFFDGNAPIFKPKNGGKVKFKLELRTFETSLRVFLCVSLMKLHRFSSPKRAGNSKLELESRCFLCYTKWQKEISLSRSAAFGGSCARARFSKHACGLGHLSIFTKSKKTRARQVK